MNINRIVSNTFAEGPGNRFAIWTQGCTRQCDGCYAVDSWSFNPHILLSVDAIVEQISGTNDIEGVTILGGEPFEQKEELAKLLVIVKKMGLSSIVFTGYDYSHLISQDDEDIKTILRNTDVLIDGPYIKDRRSFETPLIGSTNQRYIFLTDRYCKSDFKNNTVEVRITKEGIALVNGMCDFERIKSRSGDNGL